MPYITIKHKLLLRTWYRDQPTKPSQKQIATWLLKTHGATISQSQISRILSSDQLGNLSSNSPGLQNRRLRTPEWPVVENVLHKWQARLETHGIPVSREMLMEKARQIWLTFPEARNGALSTHNPPTFGQNWCTAFQKRYHIQTYESHDEAASSSDNIIRPEPDILTRLEPDILTQPETITRMEDIRRHVEATPVGNRYNMDQLGIYWRRFASSGLASESWPGRKPDMSRIMIGLTVNDTGTDRFKPWIVGDAATPGALREFDPEAHGLVWRHNSTAWFTTTITQEWLLAFYAHIHQTKPGQRVLLVLDNFTPHVSAVRVTPPPENITIDFLPANVTSVYQPCDMGIIRTLKSHYRRSFLQFITSSRNEDSNVEIENIMTLRHALSWVSHHFFTTLTNETIVNCWKKSTLLGSECAQIPSTSCVQIPADLSIVHAQASNSVRHMLSLSELLNPEDEDIPPTSRTAADAMLQEILDERFKQPVSDYGDEEEVANEMNLPDALPSVKHQEGVKALHVLIQLAETIDIFGQGHVQALHQMLGILEEDQNLQQATALRSVEPVDQNDT